MTVKNLFPGDENALFDAGGGLTRKVCAHSDTMMCVEVLFEKGTVAALHSHPHEQITYVISGKFELTVGDKTHVVGPGDSLYKQPHIVHGATCLEAGTLLDMFTPRRDDFL